MREKEKEIDAQTPKVNIFDKLIEKHKNDIKDERCKYMKNLEKLEYLRKDEFFEDRNLKICKRVMKYLDAQEKDQVLERERLIIKEMDREILLLTNKISKNIFFYFFSEYFDHCIL